MPRYAVKIGEIELQADKPISMEDRQRAIKDMVANRRPLHITEDGLEIYITIRDNY